MSERWQRELSKLHAAEVGTDLWDRILEGPRVEPVRQPRRSSAVAAAFALAVFAAAAVFVWTSFRTIAPSPGSLAGSDILNVPPRGETSPAFLADGHPVFVMHFADGGVVLLDAFSPHTQFGIRQLAVWCTTKPYFLTWPDGSFFDRSGGWEAGTPAPPGLRSYAFRVIARDANGDPSRMEVGELGLVIPHQHGNLTSQRHYPTACALSAGSSADVVEHSVPASSVWTSPAALVAADPNGWVAVRGTLTVGGEGAVRMCSSVAAGTCAAAARVTSANGAALAHRLTTDPGSRYAFEHLWFARVRGEAIVDLAVADLS
jgi:hypothetical protein